MRLAGMPDYDTATLDRLGAQEARIAPVFERHGYARIEPPVIEPADVFLELSGEEIRRRLYVFNDPSGAELCLRPELTIPACRMYLRGRKKRGAARLWYNGPAFRFQPPGSVRPNQFLQAGVECLGAGDTVQADVEVLSLGLQAVQAAGLERFDVQIGDLGLFFGLIDKLDMPERWRQRLKQQFWRPEYFRTLLNRLAKGGANGAGQRGVFLATLKGLNARQVHASVEEMLRLSGISSTGGRGIDEIAARLMQQVEDAQAGGLSPEVIGLLDGFFRISGAPEPAMRKIRALAGAARISLKDEIGAFEQRLELLRRQNIDTAKFHYVAQFGRSLEYYTGFVFELRAPQLGEHAQIAGGGRYDRLLKRLGAAREIPAVGCAIRTEWLLEACGRGA